VIFYLKCAAYKSTYLLTYLQKQVWLISIADERVGGCACKTLKSLENTRHTWAILLWWFTTKRRYIKCMQLYLYCRNFPLMYFNHRAKFVAVYVHTVWAYVQEVPKIWWGVAEPKKYALPLVLYHAEFGHCRSKRMGVGRSHKNLGDGPRSLGKRADP